MDEFTKYVSEKNAGVKPYLIEEALPKVTSGQSDTTIAIYWNTSSTASAVAWRLLIEWW